MGMIVVEAVNTAPPAEERRVSVIAERQHLVRLLDMCRDAVALAANATRRDEVALLEWVGFRLVARSAALRAERVGVASVQ